MTSYFRASAIVIGVLGVGLIAAGCSSTSTTPAAAATQATSAPATSAPATSAPATSAPAATSAAAPSPAPVEVQVKTANTSIGTVLTDSRGFTLYVFAEDTATTSACTGECAAAWPPLTGAPVAASGVALSGKLGTIKRPDGSVQATYNLHPLYTFKNDSAPGQVSGNGIPGWHAVVLAAA